MMLDQEQARILPAPAKINDILVAIPIPQQNADEWLFGWDGTPGIVSVWADRSGRALVWRRLQGQVVCEQGRYRPWIFARTLGDVSSDEGFYYHRLTGGAEGDFRYLITAHHFQTLERSILAGAARRLGQPVSRLSELDDYYSVGPVEQYLMQTGRVYFRGMTYSDLHRLQFDLKTTALRPEDGRIFLVAVRDSQGLETILEAPKPEDEAQLIHDLCALIQERDPDIIENHNLFGFDLPFLERRAHILGVPLALGRREGQPALLQRESLPGGYYRQHRYSVAGRELIDTLIAVWRYDATNRNMPGYGLKAVARYFGFDRAQRTAIHIAHVYDRYEADQERVRHYALDDVRDVDSLSKLLMDTSFVLAGMAPRPYERIATAGPAMGILEPMLVRAYLRAHIALPRSSDLHKQLTPHQGGISYLLAGGVARHVIKCDVSSMYPSIMRLYQIGPTCDRLGVLLQLVARLTELRLKQKAAARAATAGSASASQYLAQAAGMKLMINAAYGYLGAFQMALFADVAAAGSIAAQGRAILDQVVAELRSRGVALLEADTDGVYFAVPENWTEADERRLVAEVAAALPDGIKLEYDGRYEAMLSHERKNYALLTYGGKLILKGVGLINSRREPFVGLFLREAIDCLLRGDVSGVVEIYTDMVSALRERRLPTIYVACNARLTKSVNEYQRTRQRLREGPYEALLGAGRKQWEVGERVRFYHAKWGRYVWLPYTLDEIDDVAAGDSSTVQHAVASGRADDKRDYDIKYYIRLLHDSGLARLRKAFRDEDFARLFRKDAQMGLFDRAVAEVEPLWITVPELE